MVHTKNFADYNAVLRNLKVNQIAYHTYTSGKRSHAFVLRDLEDDQTIEAVQEDLTKNTKIQAIKTFRMKSATPLTMVVSNGR